MIRDAKTLHRWEAQGQRFARSSLEENVRVFWASLKMARDAGSWPPENPLEGLETDRKPARKVNTHAEGEPGKSLDRAEMPYLVIGGQAVPMYGEPRSSACGLLSRPWDTLWFRLLNKSGMRR